MENKKQSSIDWLESKVNAMIQNGGDTDLLAVIEHIQQAKAMHKSEMSKTWDSALDAGQERAWNVMRAYSDFDEYYENTFEK